MNASVSDASPKTDGAARTAPSPSAARDAAASSSSSSANVNPNLNRRRPTPLAQPTDPAAAASIDAPAAPVAATPHTDPAPSSVAPDAVDAEQQGPRDDSDPPPSILPTPCGTGRARQRTFRRRSPSASVPRAGPSSIAPSEDDEPHLLDADAISSGVAAATSGGSAAPGLRAFSRSSSVVQALRFDSAEPLAQENSATAPEETTARQRSASVPMSRAVLGDSPNPRPPTPPAAFVSGSDLTTQKFRARTGQRTVASCVSGIPASTSSGRYRL